MDRDEAHNELPTINSYTQWVEIHDVVDKIYDDFESRICENCKFYEKNPNICCNSNSRLWAEVVDNNFGCNQFEED